MKRRTFISGLGVWIATVGTFIQSKALAAWPKLAMEATEVSAAIEAIAGDTGKENSGIKIDVGKIRGVGTRFAVPVRVDATAIDGVDSISIVCPSNPYPLAAKFDIGENTKAYIATTVDVERFNNDGALLQDLEIIAVIQVSDNVFTNSQSF